MLDILCVQKTRWKGEKARCIGEGYKMWYYGHEKKWFGNHIEKGACGHGSGIVEGNRHDDRLKDGT